MRPAAALLAALLALAGMVSAEAPATSLVPKPRSLPQAAAVEPAAPQTSEATASANTPPIAEPVTEPVPAGVAASLAGIMPRAVPMSPPTSAGLPPVPLRALPPPPDLAPAGAAPPVAAQDAAPSAVVATLPAMRPRPRPQPAGADDTTAEVARAPAANAIAAASLVATTGGTPDATLRPRARPAALLRPSNPAREVAVVQVASAAAVLRSPRPEPRPRNVTRRSLVLASAAAIQTQPDPRAITGRRGSVCGDRAIRGEILAPIGARVNGCGIEAPVRITEVDGVKLSMAATVDCTTAVALRRWVSDVVKPEVGRLGGGVAQLEVMGHYSCRTRNNQPGARVSEHGRGRAIDIGGIRLANGASISVLRGWRDAQHGQILKALHRGACGIFGTVLGPASDRFHQNHFHFDTARYRSGAFCR